MRQAKYTPEIMFVSLGGETKAAGFYWEAVLGKVAAHMVHYGESSFGTVFTEPASNWNDDNFFDNQCEFKLSLTAKAAMEDAVWEACRKRGIDTEGAVHYLLEMSADEATELARHEQDQLRITIEDLKQP